MIDYGVAHRTAPGQTTSGDGHLVRALPAGTLFAVVDGIGHGREAQAVAERALAVLADSHTVEVERLMEAAHRCLRGTRGAVMSIAYYDPAAHRLAWVGVGNVEGVLVHAGPRPCRGDFLLRQAGVLGDRLPNLHASMLAVKRGDVLLFATDGIVGEFSGAINAAQPAAAIAAHILQYHAGHHDDALVLVARLDPGGMPPGV